MNGRTRDDINDYRSYIVRELQAGKPKSQLCAEFKCKPDTLNRRLREWGVDHLYNQPGKNRPKYGKRKPLESWLTMNSHTSTYHLKRRLWRDGLKPQVCEECGWAKNSVDGRLPLELHHVNGFTYDNRLENLLILCPNCHSLKPNHRGLSKGKGRKGVPNL